jgi:anti-sigma factor RsiW
MNCHEFNQVVADYIGGELDAEARTAAQQHLGVCAACRQSATELQAAAAAIEAGIPNEAEATELTAGLRPPALTLPMTTRAAGRPRVGVILRYAAVIVLAFGCGWLVRGGGASASEVAPAAQSADAWAAAPLSRQLAQQYERAARSFSNASTFSRALVTLARR